MLRISNPADLTVQMFMRQTNTLSRQFWMLTDSSSIKKSQQHKSLSPTYHIRKLIHHHNHIHKQNKSNPKTFTLNNHINKQIHEHKTNTWKKHLDKIDHKHNSHSLWCTIAKKSINKKHPTQQKRSIHFGTKTAITNIDKAKAFNKQFTNITPESTNKINRCIDQRFPNCALSGTTQKHVKVVVLNAFLTIIAV